MLLHTDARRRITIPPNAGVKPGDTLDLEILPDGRILLIPVLTIPKHQLWAWTPEALAAAADSLSDTRPSIMVENAVDVEKVAGRWEDED